MKLTEIFNFGNSTEVGLCNVFLQAMVEEGAPIENFRTAYEEISDENAGNMSIQDLIHELLNFAKRGDIESKDLEGYFNADDPKQII